MSVAKNNLSDSAKAELADLVAELQDLESNGVNAGETALVRSAEIAKRVLAIATDVLEETAAGTLSAATVGVSGTADALDEARTTVRSRPLTAILFALGIGVILGRVTVNGLPDHKAWFH